MFLSVIISYCMNLVKQCVVLANELLSNMLGGRTARGGSSKHRLLVIHNNSSEL